MPNIPRWMPPRVNVVSQYNDGYLMYREFLTNALKGRLSEARIAALNSKLGTRARLLPGQLEPSPDQTIAELMTKLRKEQAEDIKIVARDALTAFIDAKAPGLKEELEFLANFVLDQDRETKWVPGPIKKIEKAMSKTIEDYDYAFGENKDLVRGTLACNTPEQMNTVANFVDRTCRNDTCGLSLPKAVYQKSTRDDGKVKTGYSGWNFVVQFNEHAFGAEIQINTVDMLYGKHSKEEVTDWLKVGDAGYAAMQKRLGFPGGLGHAMYDIQDTARSKCSESEAEWARALSLDYNDACRGQFRGELSKSVEQLNERIRGGWGRLTPNGTAEKLWEHAVSGSDWTAYRLPRSRAEWEQEKQSSYEADNLARNKNMRR